MNYFGMAIAALAWGACFYEFWQGDLTKAVMWFGVALANMAVSVLK